MSAKASAKASAKVSAKKAAGPTSADVSGDDRWWALIDKSRRGTDGDADAQGENLIRLLTALPVEDIVAFDRFAQERVRDAFRNDLWEVAYIMNGGCSDDGFDYFLGWLVAQGKKRYEAALADPEAAAKGVSPDDEPFENEMIWYAPARAYEAKTGRGDYYGGIAPSVTRTLQGEGFDEDTVDERHPKLARRFGG